MSKGGSMSRADLDTNEFDLSHVKDIAKLSEEQFARMLPDFITWFHYAKVIEPADGEMTGFIWCDDNRPGELTRVDCTDPNTGEQFSIDLENEGADGLKT